VPKSGKPDIDAAQLAQPLMRLCPRRPTSLFDRVAKSRLFPVRDVVSCSGGTLPTRPAPFLDNALSDLHSCLPQSASRENRNRYAVVRMEHIVPQPAI